MPSFVSQTTPALGLAQLGGSSSSRTRRFHGLLAEVIHYVESKAHLADEPGHAPSGCDWPRMAEARGLAALDLNLEADLAEVSAAKPGLHTHT